MTEHQDASDPTSELHSLGLIDEEFYDSVFENTVRAIPAIKNPKIIGNLRPSFIAEVERLIGTKD